MNARVPATVTGQGPPVIFLHGVGLDRTMWSGVTAQLAQDFRCIALDLPGHGEAPPPSAAGLAGYGETLGDAVSEYCAVPPAIVGFSMGALVAATFAAERPAEVSRLVMMSAVFARDAAQRQAVRDRLRKAEEEGPGVLIEAALARWFSAEFLSSNPQRVAEIRQRLESNDAAAFLAAYRVFAAADAELTEALGRIACPVLAMTGERDANSTPAMSHALAGALGEGEPLILEGLAHGAPIEAPERVAAALRSFLSTQARRSA